MPEYLVSGRGPDGRKATENVEASSADAAVQILRDRGFDEIVLHTDEIGAHFTHQRKVAGSVSTRDYLLMRNWPRLGFFVVVTLNGYRRMWFATVCAAILLVELRLRGRPWGFWDTTCAGILLFPPAWPVVYRLVAGNPKARFRRMLDALHWGRWKEALSAADRVGPKVKPEVIALHKAQALAGMGRLEEGLKLVETFGDGKAVPEWYYRNMLSQVYVFARRQDDAIAQLEEAVALAPDNATLLVALASRIIWHRRDPRRAREYLDRARRHVMSDLLLLLADLLEGVIRLEEGHPRDALPLLETAWKSFYARRHSLAMGPVLDKTQLALALTYAAIGESDEAVRRYRQARPRLIALRSENVARYDQAIGWPHDG
jgi:tetratricopeptide (TPR) repeat protein